MRAIDKRREPASLSAHRQTHHSDYANYARKDDLREALVREQRGLCCYCMDRISSPLAGMKIEHWRCQSRYPGEQLAYRNLLGACVGGEGRPEHLQHCDTRKGDQDLRWNPADPAHGIETRLGYERDGTITSGDAQFDSDLNTVLGLNLPRLKNSRAGVLTGILEWWKGEKARLRGPVPRERLVRERARVAGGLGSLAPFSQVVVWWLDQRLAR
jgi:uncharacterized protein (TIGR02646 family)